MDLGDPVFHMFSSLRKPDGKQGNQCKRSEFPEGESQENPGAPWAHQLAEEHTFTSPGLGGPRRCGTLAVDRLLPGPDLQAQLLLGVCERPEGLGSLGRGFKGAFSGRVRC